MAPRDEPTYPLGVDAPQDPRQPPLVSLPAIDEARPFRPSRTEGEESGEPRLTEIAAGLSEQMAEWAGKPSEMMDGLADRVDVKEVLARIEERLRRVGGTQDAADEQSPDQREPASQ